MLCCAVFSAVGGVSAGDSVVLGCRTACRIDNTLMRVLYSHYASEMVKVEYESKGLIIANGIVAREFVFSVVL